MEKGEDFQKIIDDFVKDLLISFPEYDDKFKVIDYDEYYSYCKKLYPENFFNILYENDELFDNEESRFLLPDVNFKVILSDEKLSDNSKKTIWKYLQLILFSVCKGVDDKNEFGDANYLFEAIDEGELQKKIEETMGEMRNIFFNEVDPCLNDMFSEQMGDISNVENIFESFAKSQGISGEDGSGGFFESTMNQEDLKEHLNGLMGGKIGSLAKEIADEASKEFGFDESQDEKSQGELLQQFFKNPSKLLGIVKNIGGKLEEKLKSGQLKESELLEEAQEIMGKMKDVPGIKNMMSQMGMAGGNFDVKGMANKMQQSMRQAKMKERMQEKLRKNNEEKQNPIEGMDRNMTQIDNDTFVWNDNNSDPSKPLSKSKVNGKKKGTNQKKKKKKKKN
tara:strand:- start:1700 stop:2878 length:1179 start_codon:yes stop_codon:yes gene_type:complete